eukprot:GFUD01120317.1.p1 GENE.GFUD01120317.1~~GFUD01120317.1.p1  ORF type:complete len:380 (-),score=101.36 GFUD01120317.1:64-1203(-)
MIHNKHVSDANRLFDAWKKCNFDNTTQSHGPNVMQTFGGTRNTVHLVTKLTNTNDDSRSIDELVRDIEGIKEVNKKSGKKQNKKPKNQDNLEPISNVDAYILADMSNVISQQVELTKENWSLVSEDSNNIHNNKSNADEEAKDSVIPHEKVDLYDKISDVIANKFEVEFDAKQSRLNYLCKCDLERAIAKFHECLELQKQHTKELKESKLVEVKELKLLMGKAENKLIKLNEVHAYLADLEAKMAGLRMIKADLVKECVSDEKLIKKFDCQRKKLERHIENQLKKSKEEKSKHDLNIKEIRRRLVETLNSIENLLNEVSTCPIVQPVEPNKQFLEFIDKQISEKEKELGSPVCLEVARVPIFMCLESNLHQMSEGLPRV